MNSCWMTSCQDYYFLHHLHFKLICTIFISGPYTTSISTLSGHTEMKFRIHGVTALNRKKMFCTVEGKQAIFYPQCLSSHCILIKKLPKKSKIESLKVVASSNFAFEKTRKYSKWTQKSSGAWSRSLLWSISPVFNLILFGMSLNL